MGNFFPIWISGSLIGATHVMLFVEIFWQRAKNIIHFTRQCSWLAAKNEIMMWLLSNSSARTQFSRKMVTCVCVMVSLSPVWYIYLMRMYTEDSRFNYLFCFTLLRLLWSICSMIEQSKATSQCTFIITYLENTVPNVRRRISYTLISLWYTFWLSLINT